MYAYCSLSNSYLKYKVLVFFQPKDGEPSQNEGNGELQMTFGLLETYNQCNLKL